MKNIKPAILFAVVGLLSLAGNSYATSQPPPPSDDPPCADDCGYTRGPDPTDQLLEAERGPYSVATESVSVFASGFGGGTIHYPEGVSGTMGVIAVSPGYVSYESSIRWWGPRLASHGFVVITIDTITIYDQPDSRADQLEAALDYVIAESESAGSPISGMVDPQRRAVIGWSMGGGGSLKLSEDDPTIKAAIPQAPYYAGFNNFDEITTPTFIIGCQLDAIAPVAVHASPFYNDIPSSTPKLYLEINNGDHFCANSGNGDSELLGKLGVAWIKRFVDSDERYSPFLCGPDYEDQFAVSDFRNSCPF